MSDNETNAVAAVLNNSGNGGEESPAAVGAAIEGTNLEVVAPTMNTVGTTLMGAPNSSSINSSNTNGVGGGGSNAS